MHTEEANNRKLSLTTALPPPFEYDATLFSSEEDLKSKRIPSHKRKAMNDIRYASFGSSSTWGTKLPHPNKQTYTKLLSLETNGNRDNYALCASGPNYSATYAQIYYDVFILEFFDTGQTTPSKTTEASLHINTIGKKIKDYRIDYHYPSFFGPAHCDCRTQKGPRRLYRC